MSCVHGHTCCAVALREVLRNVWPEAAWRLELKEPKSEPGPGEPPQVSGPITDHTFVPWEGPYDGPHCAFLECGKPIWDHAEAPPEPTSDTPFSRLRPLVVQMVCGGDFINPKAWDYPLPMGHPLLDRCAEFILFNWPEFKLRVTGPEAPPLPPGEEGAEREVDLALDVAFIQAGKFIGSFFSGGGATPDRSLSCVSSVALAWQMAYWLRDRLKAQADALVKR